MMWFLGTRSSTAKPQLSSRYVKFWPCQAWRSQIAAPTAQKTTSLTVLPVGRRHGSFSTPHCQFFGIFVQNCQIYFFIISTFFALFNNFQDMCHKFHCMVFHTFTQLVKESKNIGHFAVLLAKLDIFHWPMLENRSKISLGLIWTPKLNQSLIS